MYLRNKPGNNIYLYDKILPKILNKLNL
jgi:hypothetical protein